VPEELGDAIDAAALETLRAMDNGDEGFMAKIIALFLGDLTERIAALGVAVKAHDDEALRRTAHALRGSCGHFGAVRMAMLCRRMEKVGTQKPNSDASETLRQLVAEAGRVRIALQETKQVSSSNSATREDSH